LDTLIRVLRVDHGSESVAREIHAVQMSAYTQEAALLGAVDFPPLRCTAQDTRTSREEFLAAYHGQHLVGSVSTQSVLGRSGKSIYSLVVAPAFQRQGIARQLMSEVLRLYGAHGFAVQTGAKNVPALNLYTQLGFLESGRWLVGHEPIEIVELQRPPVVSGSEPQNAA
jgi:ribosomal protein S18 acetylase RimI-like enzyme